MRAVLVLTSLSLVPLSVVAFTPAHPCFAFPTKVSKLKACATASEFCSSYLSGPASFTRTAVTTTGVEATVRVRLSEFGSIADLKQTTDGQSTTTTILTSPTTTVGGSTTTALSCPSTDQDARLLKRAAHTSSCGIAARANPSQVSGACKLPAAVLRNQVSIGFCQE